MSLLGDLHNLQAFENTRGPRCQVCSLLADLAADEAEALRGALADDKVSFAALSRALAKNGYRIGSGTLSRHKSGACSGTPR